MCRPWRLPFNSRSCFTAGAAIDNKNPDQPFEHTDQAEDRHRGKDDRLRNVPRQLFAGEEGRAKKVEPDGVERDRGREQQRYPWPACPDIQWCPLALVTPSS